MKLAILSLISLATCAFATDTVDTTKPILEDLDAKAIIAAKLADRKEVLDDWTIVFLKSRIDKEYQIGFNFYVVQNKKTEETFVAAVSLSFTEAKELGDAKKELNPQPTPTPNL